MTLFDPPTARLRLLIAYDGGGFHGFAPNRDVPTVAGALGDALARILGHEVVLTGAGRTDAGVHAWGQVVTFDGPADGLDLVRLQRSVNGLCGPAIVVRAVEVAEPGFDARFSAIWRRYRYTVLNREVPDPFLAAISWQVERPLDLRVMRLACDPLIGEHDFSSFCRRPKVGEGEPPVTLVRRVLSARWDPIGEPSEGLLRFEITANAFCHQMVRSIVGTLVEVGLGKRTAGSMLGTIRAKDRAAAGQMAPPHGLCLWEVGYPA
ncbi:MAG TPA: tRNA pseudouridine(38-40) synthase TruA [Acidimicrobiales bacterium]